MKLENKVAIVTGAGGGIGRSIALCLAEEGADVVVNALHKETAGKVADEIKGLGRKALAIAADVTDNKKVVQLVQRSIDTFGKIDILANNVGGECKTFFDKDSLQFVDIEEVEWDENIALNFKTQVLMARAIVPYFIKQKSGKIVNIASIAVKLFDPSVMSYGVAKTGVIHFTGALAKELGKYNINVNCICPGHIWTTLWEKEAEKFIQGTSEFKGMMPREYFLKYSKDCPIERELLPEDIAYAVVFLASDDAKNITGQTLNVDCGQIINL
ncbi:SDR family NAD(P)-dependent oxidoreductase [Chloroflexota bacterium]